ncbi:hypothetical protein A165_04065 [Vibrio tasmaniensis ZS-17]|uniref:hypothetical protein n=1 Tax=Vibrio tasmaniensis TaxID=212663 RepID=UPI0003736566|nr:hypothetical protein [Vibrio tasmaniensis]OED66392.1 hypothetical protein A165_04065 [Vibrio tasmaniensis ZS-17]
MKAIIMFILSLISFGSLAMGEPITDHCNNQSNGLRYAKDYNSKGGNFCYMPEKYNSGFVNRLLHGTPVHEDYGWKIYSDKYGKTDAYSFKVEYSHRQLQALDVNAFTELAKQGGLNNISSIVSPEQLIKLHAQPLSIEPISNTSSIRYKRRRLVVGNISLVQVMWSKTNNSVAGVMYLRYKTANYSPKKQMDYLFMQDVHN